MDLTKKNSESAAFLWKLCGRAGTSVLKSVDSPINCHLNAGKECPCDPENCVVRGNWKVLPRQRGLREEAKLGVIERCFMKVPKAKWFQPEWVAALNKGVEVSLGFVHDWLKIGAWSGKAWFGATSVVIQALYQIFVVKKKLRWKANFSIVHLCFNPHLWHDL